MASFGESDKVQSPHSLQNHEWTRMVKLARALGFGREIESILLILSDRPEEVVRKIAAKKSVGDYRLVGEKTKFLADTYFDTPNHFLSDRKLNLRIRT